MDKSIPVVLRESKHGGSVVYIGRFYLFIFIKEKKTHDSIVTFTEQRFVGTCKH